MADTRSSFNSTKAHAIEVQLQAVLLDFRQIALRLIGVNELAVALSAQIVLLVLAPTVLNDLGRLTVSTLHHISIVQSPSAGALHEAV